MSVLLQPPTVPSLRMAILGLGTAGAAMVAAAQAHPGVDLVGVADARLAELPLEGLPPRCVKAASLEELLGRLEGEGGVDAIHIATPTPLHAEQVRTAIAAGCHVIVEKPVVSGTEEAGRLAASLSGAPQAVIVGHSEAFEPYVQASAGAVAAGAVGEVQAVLALKATDWSARPRARTELEPSLGGGLVRRQGVHQMDVVRTVLGGPALEVREAMVRRGRDGQVASYLAWLSGDNGLAVVVAHEASGGLAAGRRPRSGASEEALVAAKWRRAGGLLAEAIAGRPLGLGPGDRERLVIVGSVGELVASSGGIRVSSDTGDSDIPLSRAREGRAAVLDELRAVLAGGQAVHDLAWGVENLRLCETVEAMSAAPSRSR